MTDIRFKTPYVDTNGLTHVLPYEFSENGILFTAYGHNVGAIDIETATLAVHHTIKKDGKTFWFDPQPFDKNGPDAHFSKDNMLGLYYLRIALGMSLKVLPCLHWNEDKSRHPVDVLFFRACKSSWFYSLVYPILYIASRISCKKPRKDTSGKLKWWLRWKCLELLGHSSATKAYKSMTSLIAKEHGVGGWKDVLDIYFTNNGNYRGWNDKHPILQKLKEI